MNTINIPRGDEYWVEPRRTSGGLYQSVTTSDEKVCDGTD